MWANSLLYEKKLELELIYAALWPITRLHAYTPTHAYTLALYSSFSGCGNCNILRDSDLSLLSINKKRN